MKRHLALLLALTAGGCPNVVVDENETQPAPVVEFDPARSQAEGARYLPFPNDLVRNPITGKITLSEQACESPTAKVLREGVLNTLDGFGTWEVPIQVTFSEAVDEASLDGRIVLYKMTGVAAPFGADAVPLVVRKTTTLRFSRDNCTSPESVNAVVVIPSVPLDGHSTYVVGLKSGILTADGVPFQPSLTWSLVAGSDSPVTVGADGTIVSDRTPLDPADEAQRAQLFALYDLWRAHQPALRFLDQSAFLQGQSRNDLLVAFQFTTQTLADPFDADVAGSPASMLFDTGFFKNPTPLTLGPAMALCGAEAITSPTQCFLKLSLGGCSPLTTGCTPQHYIDGTSRCAAPPVGIYDCAQVGAVLSAEIVNLNFQTQVPQTTAGLPALQGAWSDPYKPEPQGALLNLVTFIATPTGSPPTGGWPVVIFGHGLGSDKGSMFAIAGRNARAGFATVAVDFSQHGSRAVRTSTAVTSGCKGHCYNGTTDTGTECDTVLECAGGQTCGTADPAVTMPVNPPTPGSAPQCYASIFSTDFANTRDNVRQSVLDIMRVAKAMKACGTNCTGFPVNPNRISYGALSLGSIIGTMATAMSPEINRAALSVGGVGWLDILENTATLGIRCPLVDGLIDAGILMGTKWNNEEGMDATGLCTTDAWKMQPGYATFAAVARWVMDPAEPANFAPRISAKRAFIQLVVGDTVIPNVTTQMQARLIGLVNPLSSSPFNPGAPTTESATLVRVRGSALMNYATDAAHIYTHSTLLRPAGTTNPAIFGTWRMQIDFAQWLDNLDDSNL